MAEDGSWEARCVLLLWLAILVLVPFDLTTIDSRYVEPATPLYCLLCCDKSNSMALYLMPLYITRALGAAASVMHDIAVRGRQLLRRRESDAAASLAQRLADLCRGCLDSPGPEREVAALVLGRLLTRRDAGGSTADPQLSFMSCVSALKAAVHIRWATRQNRHLQSMAEASRFELQGGCWRKFWPGLLGPWRTPACTPPSCCQVCCGVQAEAACDLHAGTSNAGRRKFCCM